LLLAQPGDVNASCVIEREDGERRANHSHRLSVDELDHNLDGADPLASELRTRQRVGSWSIRSNAVLAMR
jgi:hypothetical protein